MKVYKKVSDLLRFEDFSLNLTGGRLRQPFGEHSHDFYELMIIFGGKGRHSFQGTTTAIGMGDIYVINPGTVHGFPENDNIEICNVMFDPFELGESWNCLLTHPGFQGLFHVEPALRKSSLLKTGKTDNIRLHLEGSDLNYIRSLTEHLQHMIDGNPYDNEAIIRSLLLTLSSFLSEQYMGTYRLEGDDGLLPLSRCLAFMETNFNRQDLTVEDLARSAGLSVRHLTRLFSALYKISPYKYLQNIRLEKATRMLRDTNQSITRIAFDCGFNDSNYFSQVFRRIHKMAPREFRKTGILG